MSHNRPECVLLTADLWDALREWDEYTRSLEDVWELLEDEDLKRIVEERINKPRRPAPEVVPEALALLHERLRE